MTKNLSAVHHEKSMLQAELDSMRLSAEAAKPKNPMAGLRSGIPLETPAADFMDSGEIRSYDSDFDSSLPPLSEVIAAVEADTSSAPEFREPPKAAKPAVDGVSNLPPLPSLNDEGSTSQGDGLGSHPGAGGGQDDDFFSRFMGDGPEPEKA